MPEQKAWNLVADIGGTNARFAVHDISCDEIKDTIVLSVAEHPHFLNALHNFIDQIKQTGNWEPLPRAACMAVACPVDEDLIRFTNSHWTFSKSELSSELNQIHVEVINDFTAIAYSISALNSKEWFQLGEGKPQTDKPVAILGPGTGLGMCTLVPVNHGFMVLDGEGGHTHFAPTSAQEIAILNELKTRFELVSLERLLSGAGIINIYQALCNLQSADIIHQKAADITSAAIEGNDGLAVEVLSVFCRILGTTAGNFAMMTGARGGVYIAGGIAPRIINFIANSECRSQFENKGRFTSYVKNIPLRILLKDQPGLHGAMQKLKLS